MVKKAILIIMSVVFAISFASCNKEEEMNYQIKSVMNYKVYSNEAVISGVADTKLWYEEKDVRRFINFSANGCNLVSATYDRDKREITCELVIAFEAKSGKGNVVVCGVEPVGMSSSENSYAELYEKLIIRSCQLGNLDYRAPEAMYTIRGDYYFCHAFDREIALKGAYLDLFSDNFDYLVDPVVTKGRSACYKRVQTEDIDIMHSNGNVTDFVQNSSSVTFTVSNILRSRSHTVVSTGGMPVKSVDVKLKKTNAVPEKFAYKASDDGYVTISYILNKAENVEVTVYFG